MNYSDTILMKRILVRLEGIEKEIIALGKKVDNLEGNPDAKSG